MKNRISDLAELRSIRKTEDSFFLTAESAVYLLEKKKKKVNILALGDVGGMVLIGLRLLGDDVISEIGICDVNRNTVQRYEMEAGQIQYPCSDRNLPLVKIVDREHLFDCDVMVFCASRSVPAVGQQAGDVRMAQLESNSQLVATFASQATKEGFQGIFAVVSDPVDPLCKAAYRQGLRREQIRGFGLGVMNSRAMYFAERDCRFARFLREGRAFGPHGQDLVIADSLKHYDHEISMELTRLTVESNLKTRELGFKPFIAPAFSSGAISILEMLRGNWHYSSVYLGAGRMPEEEGAFFGCRNRQAGEGIEVEDLPLPEQLFQRIRVAYENLKLLI